MSIDNINRAKCDKCQKTVYSSKKQVVFLSELHEKGWTGTINSLLCSDCSSGIQKGSKEKSNRIYNGRIKAVVRVGERYYVKVVNPNISVMIPYAEFLSLPLEGEPTLGYLCRKLRSRGVDPDAIKYVDTKKIVTGGRDFFVAKYVKG